MGILLFVGYLFSVEKDIQIAKMGIHFSPNDDDDDDDDDAQSLSYGECIVRMYVCRRIHHCLTRLA